MTDERVLAEAAFAWVGDRAIAEASASVMAAHLDAAGYALVPKDRLSLGVEEAIAEGQRKLAASEAAADREVTRLRDRLAALTRVREAATRDHFASAPLHRVGSAHGHPGDVSDRCGACAARAECVMCAALSDGGES